MAPIAGRVKKQTETSATRIAMFFIMDTLSFDACVEQDGLSWFELGR